MDWKFGISELEQIRVVLIGSYVETWSSKHINDSNLNLCVSYSVSLGRLCWTGEEPNTMNRPRCFAGLQSARTMRPLCRSEYLHGVLRHEILEPGVLALWAIGHGALEHGVLRHGMLWYVIGKWGIWTQSIKTWGIRTWGIWHVILARLCPFSVLRSYIS